MQRSLLLGAAIAAAGLAATPASAVITTLDFQGAICGTNGRSACGNGAFIGQRYGDSIRNDVAYRTIDVRSQQTVEGLRYWGRQFGDLAGVAFGGYESYLYRGEITITAAAGYGVSLIGFDAACYRNGAPCQVIDYDVVSLSGVVVEAGVVGLPKLNHSLIEVDSAYYAGLTIRWDESFDVGLDNIRFDVIRVRNPLGSELLDGGPLAPVPEPATWGLMLAGFGLVGAAVRRRRVVAA